MFVGIHMNAIIIFSVSHLFFSSSVVAMTTSRLTGVCMTSNDVPGINQFMKITIARSLETYCREERHYDSDLASESEDCDWFDTENQRCRLFD